MGRPKGIKPHKWLIEEKIRNVNGYFNEGIGIKRLAREENMAYAAENKGMGV